MRELSEAGQLQKARFDGHGFLTPKARNRELSTGIGVSAQRASGYLRVTSGYLRQLSGYLRGSIAGEGVGQGLQERSGCLTCF